MSHTNLSVAVDLYDRHLPLFGGQVAPADGLNLTFLEVGMAPPRRHGINRHKRMLVDREFDAAEVSRGTAAGKPREKFTRIPEMLDILD